MKFVANIRIEIGSVPNVKTVQPGEVLPTMPVEELLRLQDLDAITGVEDAASVPTGKAAKNAPKDVVV